MAQATVLRNPNLSPLTEKQLRDYCPAIFTKEPHPDVSDRYGFIPTYEVLEAMADAKFVPVEARAYTRVNADARKYARHLIRFRQAGKLEANVVGDVVPQVVMLNAHDRTARYQLYGGMFRLVCANGLIVATDEYVQPYVARHTKGAAEEVVDNAKAIIKQHGEVFQHVNAMRKIDLTLKQRTAFAKSALTLRPDRPGIISPDSLLTPRRKDDDSNSLWHVYNVVQENLTKGGIPGVTANGRTVRTAEIRSVHADMVINRGIWSLAMQALAKAKGGKS